MNKHLAIDEQLVNGTASVSGVIRIVGGRASTPTVCVKAKGTTVDVSVYCKPLVQADGKYMPPPSGNRTLMDDDAWDPADSANDSAYAITTALTVGDELWKNFVDKTDTWFYPATDPAIHMSSYLKITVVGETGNGANSVVSVCINY